MAKTGSTFNPHVHGARGLFSLMVFIFHISYSGLPTLNGIHGSWVENYLLFSMKFGVELFFGISGIVIVGALARAPSMRSFAWDRISRIYPLLWVTILFITALLLISGGSTGRQLPSPGQWLANFLAPPPFINIPLVHPAAWSLGYEFTFYALAGIGWTLRRRGVPYGMAIMIAVGAVLLALYPRSMLMVAGVLIACGMMGRTSWLARWARFPIPNFLVFLILWRLADMAVQDRVEHLSPLFMPFNDWVIWLPLIVITGLFGGVALLGIHEGHGMMGRLLRSRPMLWMGTISYSFYLWHPLVLAIVKQLFYRGGIVTAAGPYSQLLFAVATFPPALLLSHASQRLLEVRVTRWLRRIGPDDRRSVPPVATTAVNG